MLSKAFPLFIGKPTIELEHIDSTNVYAAELVSTGNPSEGTVIYAHHQTQGIGQFGREWSTEEGKNITLSIILKPTFIPALYQYDLTKLAALAVAQWLENYIDKEIYIKWPNDIYVERKKIGGILIQNILSKNVLQYSIIGIGINVNQQHFDSSIPNPTSFLLETNKEYDLIDLRSHLYSNVEQNYLLAKRKGHDQLTEAYLERLFQLNEYKPYILNGNQEVMATIRNVERQGKLVLERNGGISSYSLNEVKHVI